MPKKPSQNPKQHDVELARMRWFILIALLIFLFASLIATIVIVFITKSFLASAIPPATFLLLKPIVVYLFPAKKENLSKSKGRIP